MAIFWELGLIFLAALAAFTCSAVAGGGASLVLMPVLGSLLPVASVPGAITIGSVFSSVARLWAFWRSIRWDIVAWFVPAALPAAALGVGLLRFINPMYLEIGLGLYLVANLSMLLQKPSAKAEIKNPHLSGANLALIGAAAGFVSGLSGAVGLLFNRFYLRNGLTSQQVVATRAANEILLHLLKLGLYIYLQILSEKALSIGLAVAAGAILSAWLSKRLVTVMPENIFRQVGYGAMVLAGCSMLFSGSKSLAASKGMQGTFAVISGGLDTKLSWPKGSVALEFSWDEGLDYEQGISFNDLPASIKARFQKEIKPGLPYQLEEVFSAGKHGYELYVLREGKVVQIEVEAPTEED